MVDNVDEAFTPVGNDCKPSPPSPSPSPDANDCTGAFIRLQHGLAFIKPAYLDSSCIRFQTTHSEQNKPSPGNENERSLSSQLHPELPPVLYVYFLALAPWRIPDVNLFPPNTPFFPGLRQFLILARA